MQNFYDLLGARPDDDAEAIKRAFRKAAKACHPDHHGGDPEAAVRFREVARAYEVLGDAEQRVEYDRLLECEVRPLRHRLRRSFAHIKRPAGYDLAVAAVLAMVLIAGYKLYDRIPDMRNDWAARIMARQSAPPAEPERPGGGTTLQMPLLPTPTPAMVPAPPANGADQAEAAGGEPSSPPAERGIAVASRPSDFEVPADAGGLAKTEGNGPDSKAPAPGAANGGVKPPEARMPGRPQAKRHVPSRLPSQQVALEIPHQGAAAPAAPQPAAAGPAPDSAPARVLGVGF